MAGSIRPVAHPRNTPYLRSPEETAPDGEVPRLQYQLFARRAEDPVRWGPPHVPRVREQMEGGGAAAREPPNRRSARSEVGSHSETHGWHDGSGCSGPIRRAASGG